MNFNAKIGLCGALLCVLMPFASRLPHGWDWVAKYFFDGVAGTVFFMFFFFLPGIVVFFAFLISKKPYYVPGVTTTIVCLSILAFYHSDNDPYSDPQAPISLLFISIYAVMWGILSAALGFIVQVVVNRFLRG